MVQQPEEPKIYSKLNELIKKYNYSTSYSSFSGRTLIQCEDMPAFKAGLAELREAYTNYTKARAEFHKEMYNRAKDFLTKEIGIRETVYTGKTLKSTPNKFFTLLDEAIRERYKTTGIIGVSELTICENQIAKFEKEEEAKKTEAELAKRASGKLDRLYVLAKDILSTEQISLLKTIAATTEQIQDLIAEVKLKQAEGCKISCQCDECETYEIGERRCTCGNRRISAEVEFYDDGKNVECYITTSPY